MKAQPCFLVAAHEHYYLRPILDVSGAPMTYYQIFNRDLAVSVWAEL